MPLLILWIDSVYSLIYYSKIGFVNVYFIFMFYVLFFLFMRPKLHQELFNYFFIVL